MIASDILSFLLRVGELAFSATVAGITGWYLHQIRSVSDWSKKRFIYTEVVAALSILFSLVFLIPFTRSFMHWPIDLVLFVLWMVAFGLLVNFIGPMHCGSIWGWDGITGKSTCSKFKADIAFCFLASIFFLASALLGLYVMHRRRTGAVAGDRAVTGRRRKWYSSSAV